MDRCIRSSRRSSVWVLALGIGVAGAMGTAPSLAQEMCGGSPYPFPYADVSGVGPAFCPGIMEAYVTGVSKGTAPTTFSPNETVTRVQMTTFLQRSLDQGLSRSSRRAALNQWWTPQNPASMQTIVLGSDPQNCVADGESIWISTISELVQVQANTGKVLGTWSGPIIVGVLVEGGKVFVTDESFPGSLYVVDPTQPPGTITVAATGLGNDPVNIAFDGTNIWTANQAIPGGSVSIITPQATIPYPVTTVTTGFSAPYGILFDGANIWVTDSFASTLLKLDPSGNILQTVPVGLGPLSPVFDGANIWVPNKGDNSITVVQASTGNVVATINADANNHLSGPVGASFDGERVLVTNAIGNSLTVFKAADLSFIANVTTGSGTEPVGACSDGINFWIPLENASNLLRF
jgi:DNA-binding beta-propeller fold protein YncE